MTESVNGVVAESPAAVVRAFYQAVNARDQVAIGDLIDRTFDPGVVLILPPSLPYGGRFEGIGTLRKMFTRMAASTVPLGPASVEIVSIVDGGDQVAAHLEFGWHAPGSASPLPSGALELWSFAGSQAHEIRAFYWDTAACVQEMQSASS